VAVRVGFDDNGVLGEKETGGRTALPIFREIMLRVYERQLVGPVPSFPRELEEGIDRYLVWYAARQAHDSTTKNDPGAGAVLGGVPLAAGGLGACSRPRIGRKP